MAATWRTTERFELCEPSALVAPPSGWWLIRRTNALDPMRRDEFEHVFSYLNQTAETRPFSCLVLVCFGLVTRTRIRVKNIVFKKDCVMCAACPLLAALLGQAGPFAAAPPAPLEPG
jgi:hypothetical protein